MQISKTVYDLRLLEEANDIDFTTPFIDRGRVSKAFEFALNFRKFLSAYFELGKTASGRIYRRSFFWRTRILTPCLATFIPMDSVPELKLSFCDFVERFQPECVKKIFEDKLLIWSRNVEYPRNRHRITLSSSDYPREGALSIEYYFNGVLLYCIMFSVLPGQILSVPDEKILLISMSKSYGPRALRRTAARDNGDLQPFDALMIALAALSISIGIGVMIGVKAKYQMAVYGDYSKALYSYDLAWEENGGVDHGLFYSIDVLKFADFSKPIRGSQKTRTMRRRLDKSLLLEELSRSFEGLIRPEGRA